MVGFLVFKRSQRARYLVGTGVAVSHFTFNKVK